MHVRMLTGFVCAVALSPIAALAGPAHTGRSDHARIAHAHDIGTVRGDREVHALNALEAAGYRDIKEVRVKGKDVTAQAMLKGKTAHVTVTPKGKILSKI